MPVLFISHCPFPRNRGAARVATLPSIYPSHTLAASDPGWRKWGGFAVSARLFVAIERVQAKETRSVRILKERDLSIKTGDTCSCAVVKLGG